jgi:uncharacterized membrane protein
MSLRVLSSLPLWLWLCGILAVGWAAPSTPDSRRDVGFVEGRIVALGERATVALRGGETVEAELPTPLPDGAGAPNFDLPEYRVGEWVELYYAPHPEGGVRYVVSDWVRRPALGWLLGLFLLVATVIARGKGFRAVLATGSSLLIAIAFVVPAILAGWNPMVVSLLGVGGMLVLAIYFVHGVSWSTTAALLGTFVAVVVTMLLGVLFTRAAHLTGLGSDEALSIAVVAAQVDLRGLLLAGLLIGALGALTDITIVQASVVRELAHVNPSFSLRELYTRGMNVGVDHVGSLVNTLVLAYTGAALPLLVLLSVNDFTLARALNFEFVASEVVHTLVGSVGLILAVPLTTFIAALMFRGDKLALRRGELNLHAHPTVGELQRARQFDLQPPRDPEAAARALLRRREATWRGRGK